MEKKSHGEERMRAAQYIDTCIILREFLSMLLKDTREKHKISSIIHLIVRLIVRSAQCALSLTENFN